MTEPTNQPAAELPDDTHPFLLPCPLNHYVSAGLRVRKDNPRVICLDCGLSMEATDFPTLYERWNARHQPPAIPLDAREIVGTVFDNTDASHETLKETVIDRIAAALTTTPAASGPLACTECPYVFTEAEIAAEDKKAWGHPCHGVKDQPDAFCESFRELVLDTSISAAIAEQMTDDELRAAYEYHRKKAAEYADEGSKIWRMRVRSGIATDADKERLRTLQPSTPSELVDQGRE